MLNTSIDIRKSLREFRNRIIEFIQKLYNSIATEKNNKIPQKEHDLWLEAYNKELKSITEAGVFKIIKE
ncbi:MAG: hypothetical protein CMB97_00625 [Flavobacteriaceae bacterium]|nr:hypothetical protein [Flavobacteriaceae bacterium]